MAGLKLSAGGKAGAPLATGRVVLVLDGQPVEIELAVPAGPASVQDVLPVLQGLASFLAERAAAKAEGQGRVISCRAGCGACCRQLVPITPSEARAVAQLVEAMPEPRRARVGQKFADALDVLAAAGLLERLNTSIAGSDRVALAMDYMRLGVACPFLEDEACSIHPDRPLICREYLVTSPAANCAAPTPETVGRVPFDAVPSKALSDEDGGWTPLVLALRFCESAPPGPQADGPAVIGALFHRLAKGDTKEF